MHEFKCECVHTCLYINVDARGLCPSTYSTPWRQSITLNWKIYFSYAGELSRSALLYPPTHIYRHFQQAKLHHVGGRYLNLDLHAAVVNVHKQ